MVADPAPTYLFRHAVFDAVCFPICSTLMSSGGGRPNPRQRCSAISHHSVVCHSLCPFLQVVADLTPDCARVLWASKTLEVRCVTFGAGEV